MRIANIHQTKQGRFALFDDNGEFLCSVDGETLYHHQIKEGSQLDEASLHSLRASSETRKAKDAALRYLSLRSHASEELYQKLCRKFDSHSAAFAVAEMQRLALLDDLEFAKKSVVYLQSRHKSSREIEQKLRQKGIDKEIIVQVMQELEMQDTSACQAIVERHYRRKLLLGETEKVFAALARRGFSYQEAKRAIQAVLDQQEDE